MRKLGLVIGCLFISLIATAQDATGITITVTIDNVKSDDGKVLLSLYSSADTFLKAPGIQSIESTIVDGKVSIEFKNVAPGTYAIIALHDANENGNMDFDGGGMPLESFGMSGNDMSFGPPSFDAAKFDVTDSNQEFEIRF